MKTVKVLISGTVQGIFFRRFAKDEAEKIGVKGFVRNLDDGNIEVIIEGEPKKVEEMIKRCKIGPAYSKIKDVKIEEIKHQGFDSFKILDI